VALADRGFENQDGDDDGWSKKSVGYSDIIAELQSIDDLMGVKKLELARCVTALIRTELSPA
jgi:hypothetical protein